MRQIFAAFMSAWHAGAARYAEVRYRQKRRARVGKENE
jgi:hypothetical protein